MPFSLGKFPYNGVVLYAKLSYVEEDVPFELILPKEGLVHVLYYYIHTEDYGTFTDII